MSDGTKMNEERLGAVKCIELAVKHFKITDHLIVVGGCVMLVTSNLALIGDAHLAGICCFIMISL